MKPFRIEVDAMPFAIGQRDSLAQRLRAERLGIAERPTAERLARRRDRGRRRTRRRLADLHMDDPPPQRLEPRGRSHHVHHHKWRYTAACGRPQ
jgi:hypothetical protein